MKKRGEKIVVENTYLITRVEIMPKGRRIHLTRVENEAHANKLVKAIENLRITEVQAKKQKRITRGPLATQQCTACFQLWALPQKKRGVNEKPYYSYSQIVSEPLGLHEIIDGKSLKKFCERQNKCK